MTPEQRDRLQSELEQRNEPTSILMWLGHQLGNPQLIENGIEDIEPTAIDKAIKLIHRNKNVVGVSVEAFLTITQGLSSKEHADKYQKLLKLILAQNMHDIARYINPIASGLVRNMNTPLDELDKNSITRYLNTARKKGKIEQRAQATKHKIKNNSQGKGKKRKKKKEFSKADYYSALKIPTIIANFENLLLAIFDLPDDQTKTIAFGAVEQNTFYLDANHLNVFDIILFLYKYSSGAIKQQAADIHTAFSTQSSIVGTDTVPKSENTDHHLKVMMSFVKTHALAILLGFSTTQENSTTGGSQQVQGIGKMTKETLDKTHMPFFLETLPGNPDKTDSEILRKSFILKLNHSLASIIQHYSNSRLPYKGAIFSVGDDHHLLTWAADLSLERIDNETLTWRSQNAEIQGVADQSNIDYIAKQIGAFLKDPQSELLSPAHLEAIFNFLSPGEKIKPNIPIEDLKHKARGGLYPISKRGVLVKLRKRNQTEKPLTDIGITAIKFQRSEQNNEDIEISFRWGEKSFDLTLDQNFEFTDINTEIQGLTYWLQVVTYTYLIAIKNRDIYQQSKSPGNLKEDTSDKKERKRGSNSAYLKVLPYGYTPQRNWIDNKSKINKKTKQQFGYSLTLLNRHFLSAQANPSYLQYITDFNLRAIIESALSRLKDKAPMREDLHPKTTRMQQTVAVALLGKDAILPEIKQTAYLNFIDEPDDVSENPLTLSFKNAAKDIFANQSDDLTEQKKPQ